MRTERTDSPARPSGEPVWQRVAAQHAAAAGRLHLIASENTLTPAARLPCLTEVAARYSFPAADGEENWAWPGRRELAHVEREAAGRIGAQLGAAHVCLKPISGLSALTIALSALTRAGDAVWNLGESDGGHGSTRFVGTRLGLAMRDLPCDPARYTLDIERLTARLRGGPPPALVYLDPFMALFPIDLGALREAVGPQTLIHYDASHTLGLIAGGCFQDPLREGADSIGGSTHKTYPGPHRGVLATNRAELAETLAEHASHFVSHHHPADLAALAVTAVEMDARGVAYARRTIANARALGAALAERGFNVCAAERGFTACHQLWLDVSTMMDAERAARLLYEAGLVVNAIPIPYLRAPAGLRLGVQEASWAGMGVAAMDEVADVFAAVLRDHDDPAPWAKRIRELVETHRPPGAERLLPTAVAALGERR